MIMSFKCKDTEKLFNGSFIKKLPASIQRSALRKLKMIDAASLIDSLKVPAENRLEVLKGDRKGQYSIRINDQWRICFLWEQSNAFEVEIVDYH